MNGEDLPGLDEIADPYLYDWIQGDRPNVPEDHYFSISLRELDDLVAEVRHNEYVEAAKVAQASAELRIAHYKKKIDDERADGGERDYRAGKRDMALKVTSALEPAMKLIPKWDKEDIDKRLAELFDREL